MTSVSSGDEKEAPTVVEKAQQATLKVMGFFPVRVFQRFTSRNGNVLAAGASYQALFAIFAALYVAFAVVGVWLGGSRESVSRLIDLVNGYIPGVIGDGDNAVISRDSVFDIASQSGATLSITGIVALLVVFWTAVAWIGSIRITVRDIFGLSAEKGNPVLLQARDLLAAIGFALLLLVGAVLGWTSTAALGWLFSLLGWTDATWLQIIGQIVTIAVMFLIDAVTLVLLFRFLTGTNLSTRDVLPGSLIGGAAIAVLQLAFGFLIGKTPSNPLLVTFAVLIGLLAWIRFVMMAILLSAAWVAESADQKDIQLETLDERDQAIRDAVVLRDAARLAVAQAQRDLAASGFWGRARARRALAHAENDLDARAADLEALNLTPIEAAAAARVEAPRGPSPS